ncbi:hypothetical protein [Streptomyces alboniger]|uniref:Uncharacterized protein n=1 Tax=Streptomyces alboniger TaxID=132473 RepID=A0A5J6HDI2_STRAD|nr:hypothetical protein [Streptomyces alboniger]QEV16391.1 hypothetical protein CP975_01710 [Streptomyces alboniger]
MTDDPADNRFSISVCDVQVDLPHRDDGEWTLRDILDWAPEHSAWHTRKRCLRSCGGSCLIVPEGTLVEVPKGDAMQVTLVAPAEVARRIAEGRMWAESGT